MWSSSMGNSQGGVISQWLARLLRSLLSIGTLCHFPACQQSSGAVGKKKVQALETTQDTGIEIHGKDLGAVSPFICPLAAGYAWIVCLMGAE